MAGIPAPLEVQRDETDPQIVLRLAGVLDISTVSILREAVEPHLRAGADVVVDLSHVTFCDSTGLGAIVGLDRLANPAGAGFSLRSPAPRVAAVLAMTGVDQVVTVVGADGSSIRS
jgi:anti-sigma B factor antagonist